MSLQPLGAFSQIDLTFSQNGHGSQVGPHEKPWILVMIIITHNKIIHKLPQTWDEIVH
jgi:hypothetical protein